MEFDEKGSVVRFDIGDILTVKGDDYIIDKSAAYCLNWFLNRKETLLESGMYEPDSFIVSLRRRTGYTHRNTSAFFTHTEVFSSILTGS
ncbi:MAG: hypothetical protein PHQ59_04590 [Candidatus Daviesbacteria bacterium]|nr:hypothetical protein [Candidatus Daviesbacteria bacterium]